MLRESHINHIAPIFCCIHVGMEDIPGGITTIPEGILDSGEPSPSTSRSSTASASKVSEVLTETSGNDSIRDYYVKSR